MSLKWGELSKSGIASDQLQPISCWTKKLVKFGPLAKKFYCLIPTHRWWKWWKRIFWNYIINVLLQCISLQSFSKCCVIMLCDIGQGVRTRSPFFFLRRSFWRRQTHMPGYIIRDQQEQADEVTAASQTDVTCEPVPPELASKNTIMWVLACNGS